MKNKEAPTAENRNIRAAQEIVKILRRINPQAGRVALRIAESLWMAEVESSLTQ